MGTLTDYQLPVVREALEECRRLLGVHRQACEPCGSRRPSKSAWCPDGWQLHGAARHWQNMISRMEAIQLEERQLSLF